MMELFDSHCHVDEPKFDEDRDTVLLRMKEKGVAKYAVIGSDMATSATVRTLRLPMRDAMPQ